MAVLAMSSEDISEDSSLRNILCARRAASPAPRFSASDIAAARAKLPHILPMRLKRAGNLLVGLCPIHKERTPSFTVYPDWHFYCFGCGAAGDAISWVQRTKGLAFPDAVRELCGGLPDVKPGGPPHGRMLRGSPASTPSLVPDLWRAATAPRIAEFYLQSRGLAQRSLPEALRGHPRVWCKETNEARPAMLAAVTGPSGDLVAVQRTWVRDSLTFDGSTKYEKGARCIDLSAGKKCLGQLGTGAVKLAAAGEVLGIAEGVESSLAAAKLFRIPVWAACGAQRLGNVELPQIVRRVVIFGDNDRPTWDKRQQQHISRGRAAAAKAEAAYRRRGYSVEQVFPEEGLDWAGMLI